MNKVTHLISCSLFISCMQTAMAASTVYRCTDQNGHITLQDSICPDTSFQHELPMPTFGPSGSDALRPNELASLDRLHEHTILNKTYELENRNTLALARVKHKHIQEFEKLRHQHAIEMFDRNYRHFWINGYSIGDAPLSFAEAYATESTSQNTTGSTQTNNQTNSNDNF